jgi:DNA-binding NarL/FixJ family response regulator
MNDLNFFIVANEPFYSTLLNRELNNLGYENIRTFYSGEQTIKNLGEKPDVVLLDIDLDNFTGADVLKQIKAYDPNFYVVVFITQDELPLMQNLLKLGAFEVIQKGDKEQKELEKVIKKIIDILNSLNKL